MMIGITTAESGNAHHHPPVLTTGSVVQNRCSIVSGVTSRDSSLEG